MSVNKTGGEVLAYCGKCKLNLTHTIVAMVGGTIEKCICKTCKATHKFKLPKDDSEVEAGQKVKRARARGESVGRAKKQVIAFETMWKEAIEGAKDPKAHPYSIKNKYNPGQIISHPTFGRGFVQDTPAVPQKITVLFQDKERVLIHNK